MAKAADAVDLSHLRVLEPASGIYAYYDGRVAGQRFAPAPNWVDEGAIELGIATYALVAGPEALVYDTHVSPAHGRAIRTHLEGLGVRRFTLVYSHWHLDHVAGSAAFAGAQVIANRLTAAHLARHRAAIEAGTLHGPPAIRPLVLPDRLFDGRMELSLGPLRVELIAANIHSDDATVLWLPDRRILLAGDTVEDCVTYVGAPEDFAVHRRDLARLAALEPARVLPDHGSDRIIAAGGYGPEILAATDRYIGWLQGLADDPGRAETPLAQAIGADLAAGTLDYFAPYEPVHRQNIQRTLAHFGGAAAGGGG